MPEIRKDPVFGRWVIIASKRGLRPNDFRGGGRASAPGSCPFCPGHEKETPPAVHTLRGKAGKGWRLRVVRNKYPALVPGRARGAVRNGVYARMNGVGSHEVVIETPGHDRQLEDLPVSGIADVFRTFAARVREIKKDPGIKYVMVFKNFGSNAGASLSHPHSQLIAMPIPPIRVAQEIEGAAAYMRDNGACVFCDILRQELRYGKRVVGKNRDFIAITPYASRFSFETWILPRKHGSHFEHMPPGAAVGLASMVKEVLLKLRGAIKGFSYNLMVHSMPVQAPSAAHYHWHIEIMPKLSQAAGFEWGTGFYINAVSPEEAAGIMNSKKKHAA